VATEADQATEHAAVELKEEGVTKCPVCDSVRVVVAGRLHLKASCSRCGAGWIQEGAEQRAVHYLDAGAPNISRVSIQNGRPAVDRSAPRGT